MKRGEIRWYRFRAPDKKRPILILTRTAILDHLGEVTVAPLTTTIRDIPSEVALTIQDGVPRESAVNCDHIQTVSKSKLGPVIATLSKEKMYEVSEAIHFALGL